MRAFVSYTKNFGENGTVYTQVIRAIMTESELNEINAEMKRISEELKSALYSTSQSDINSYDATFYFYVGRTLVKGVNYLSLTQLKYFAPFVKYYSFRPIRLDYNTILKIELI